MSTDDLETAMKTLRKSRVPLAVAIPPGDVPARPAAPPPPAAATRSKPTGKPRAKPKAKATGGSGKDTAQGKPKTATRSRPAPPIVVPEILDDDPCGSSKSKSGIADESGMPEVNIKDQLTEREQLFIEIFLAGGTTRDEGMISAGYGNYSQSHRMGLSRKIIAKYESLAGEHRKTFRAVGAGEVAVAQGLLDLATNSKSEMVRLNAWTAIGKILGLTQDVVAVNQGIQIVIKGRGEDSGRPAAQVQREPAKMVPRAMAITK